MRWETALKAVDVARSGACVFRGLDHRSDGAHVHVGFGEQAAVRSVLESDPGVVGGDIGRG